MAVIQNNYVSKIKFQNFVGFLSGVYLTTMLYYTVSNDKFEEICKEEIVNLI